MDNKDLYTPTNKKNPTSLNSIFPSMCYQMAVTDTTLNPTQGYIGGSAAFIPFKWIAPSIDANLVIETASGNTLYMPGVPAGAWRPVGNGARVIASGTIKDNLGGDVSVTTTPGVTVYAYTGER